MNKKLIGVGALAVIAVSIALTAWLRVHAARQFAEPVQVQTYSGTNYVVQILEATVGKAVTGCVLLVSARLENPNAFDLTLQRDWFYLVDGDKDYFAPVTTGTQTGLIKLPAHGTAEKEAFSYVVPDDTLAGTIAFAAGHHYLVLIKNAKPLSEPLQAGQFRTFRQRSW